MGQLRQRRQQVRTARPDGRAARPQGGTRLPLLNCEAQRKHDVTTGTSEERVTWANATRWGEKREGREGGGGPSAGPRYSGEVRGWAGTQAALGMRARTPVGPRADTAEFKRCTAGGFSSSPPASHQTGRPQKKIDVSRWTGEACPRAKLPALLASDKHPRTLCGIPSHPCVCLPPERAQAGTEGRPPASTSWGAAGARAGRGEVAGSRTQACARGARKPRGLAGCTQGGCLDPPPHTRGGRGHTSGALYMRGQMVQQVVSS